MRFLYLLPGAFLAPVIHEMTKARVSAALGDPTPRKNGFLTFNPFKFSEPIGFIMMLYFRMGWGQPVPTSPFMYKNKRQATLMVYGLPIIANLVVGIAAIAVLNMVWPGLQERAVRTLFTTGSASAANFAQHVRGFLLNFGQMNIALALFNLIPVHPLGMNKIVHLFISPQSSVRFTYFEKQMQFFLLLFLLFGFVQSLIFPLVDMIVRFVP
jgi:Zn-dependent protease